MIIKCTNILYMLSRNKRFHIIKYMLKSKTTFPHPLPGILSIFKHAVGLHSIKER